MSNSIDIIKEQKEEYSEHLYELLHTFMYIEYKNIYNDALNNSNEKSSHSSVLKRFQDKIADIPNWNQIQVESIYERFCDKSKCLYFADLLKTVYILTVKMVLLGLPKDKRNTIQIKKPTPENFLHRLMIHIARELWKRPYIFYHKVKSVEYQNNIYHFDNIVKNKIGSVIRDTLPMDVMVKYMSSSDILNMCEGSDSDEDSAIEDNYDNDNSTYLGGNTNYEESDDETEVEEDTNEESNHETEVEEDTNEESDDETEVEYTNEESDEETELEDTNEESDDETEVEDTNEESDDETEVEDINEETDDETEIVEDINEETDDETEAIEDTNEETDDENEVMGNDEQLLQNIVIQQPIEHNMLNPIDLIEERQVENTNAVIEDDIIQPFEGTTEVIEEDIIQPFEGTTAVAEEDIMQPFEGTTAVVEEDIMQSFEGTTAVVEEDIMQPFEGTTAVNEPEPIQEDTKVNDDVVNEPEPIQEDTNVNDDVVNEPEPIQEDTKVNDEVVNEPEPIQEDTKVNESAQNDVRVTNSISKDKIKEQIRKKIINIETKKSKVKNAFF